MDERSETMPWSYSFDKPLLKNFKDTIENWCQTNMPVYAMLKYNYGWKLVEIDNIAEGGDNPVYTFHSFLCHKYVIYKNLLDENDWVVVHIDFADRHCNSVLIKLIADSNLEPSSSVDESGWEVQEHGINVGYELVQISLHCKMKSLND